MKKNPSRGLLDRWLAALKKTVKFYQGWNVLILFLGSIISTYFIFILRQYPLEGAETIFGTAGLFYFLISNAIIVTMTFLLYFLT